MEQKNDYMNVMDFQTAYPTKEDKIKALTEMTDEQINYLIETCNNIYGKIFYSSYLKKKRRQDIKKTQSKY